MGKIFYGGNRMRTATHFCRGKDYKEFCKIFAEYYPVGKVTVIADDVEKGRELAKILGVDYNVFVYQTNNVPGDIENARFIIGVGGKGVIPAVKRASKTSKFAFIATEYDYRYLYDFDGSFRLPEFVFLEETVMKTENIYASIYISVFELYSEIVFRLVYQSMYPYRDKVFERMKDLFEKFLSGETDYSDYFSEGLRLTEIIVNEMFMRKTQSLITAKICTLGGMTLSDRFGTAYFLQLLVMNFTKRCIRDILIPSEKLLNYKTVPAGVFDARIINGEILTKCARKARALTEIVPPSTTVIVKVLSAVTDESNPLFSIINNKGIPDALYYEKFKRN